MTSGPFGTSALTFQRLTGKGLVSSANLMVTGTRRSKNGLNLRNLMTKRQRAKVIKLLNGTVVSPARAAVISP